MIFMKYISNLKKTIKNLIFLKNVTFLTIPSLLSIAIALISVPVHLKYAGKTDYGNYLFYHFFFSAGLLFNFGFSKIASIDIVKKKIYKEVINQSLFYTLLLSLFLFFISLIFLNIFNRFDEYFIIFSFGISLTILYLTLEGILQGLKKFKALSIINFIFYSVSLGIPSIYLLVENNLNYIDLIKLSLFIKLVAILLTILIIKPESRSFNKNYYKFISEIKLFSSWYLIHNIINLQIYVFLDKYLIKFFLGPLHLAIYSIPTQITEKLSVISKSFSAVLLPEISEKKNKSENFLFSIKFFSFVVPLLIFLVFFFLDDLLLIWLIDSYSREIGNLTKIFFVASYLSSISHILITFFEGTKKIKTNVNIELSFSFFFICLLIFAVSKNNLIFISCIILFKEFILLFFRFLKAKLNYKILFFIFFSFFIAIICLISSIYFKNNFIYSYLLLFICNIFFLFKLKK